MKTDRPFPPVLPEFDALRGGAVQVIRMQIHHSDVAARVHPETLWRESLSRAYQAAILLFVE